MRLVVFKKKTGDAVAISPSIVRVEQHGDDLYIGGHCGGVYKLHESYTFQDVVDEIDDALKDYNNGCFLKETKNYNAL